MTATRRAGDSRNLSYIPSNTFDIVYSGYITPLQDPLHYGSSWQMKLQDDCTNNPQKVKEAQILQNEWYKGWINEMIRIAKYGAPIIVEQVSQPYCNHQTDFGGISNNPNDSTYGYIWNVNDDNIGSSWSYANQYVDKEFGFVFGNDTLLNPQYERYHVAFRKIKKKQN